MNSVRARRGAFALSGACAVLAVLVLFTGAASRSERRPVAGAALAQGPGEGGYVHESTWALDAALPALAQPTAIAIGADGALYVADAATGRILVFPRSGAPRIIEPPFEAPCRAREATCPLVPIALAADPARDAVYAMWTTWVENGGKQEAASSYFERLPTGTNDRIALGQGGLAGFGMDVDDATGDVLYFDGRESVRHLDPIQGVVTGVTYVGGAGARGRIAAVSGSRIAALDETARAVRFWSYDGDLLGSVGIDYGIALDVATTSDGRVLVLVRPADRSSVEAVAIVVIDPDALSVSGTYSWAELGAPVVPEADWPWDLTTSQDGFALVTGINSFEVHEWDDSRQPRRHLEMSELGSWNPVRPAMSDSGSKIALATGPAESLWVLAGPTGRVISYARDGTASLGPAVPRDTVDLVALDDGLVVTTAGGLMSRLSATNTLTATWSISCSCQMGGRLTTVGGIAYVTRPRDREVAAVDIGTSAIVARVRAGDAFGLWPSDVTTSPSGRLLTADLMTSEIQAWLDPSAPEVTWQAGLLAGPRRLTSRRLDDGAGLLAAIMADGYVELHETDGGNLISRWRPTLSDGTDVAAADIALGAAGEVYLADAGGQAIHVFARGEGPTPTPVAQPSATPTPSDRSCRVSGDKVAAPSTVILGQSASVTLTLAADCPVKTAVTGADVALVLDRSGSMSGPNINAAKEAATSFVELLDIRYHRLAIVSFADNATLDVPLTHNSVSAADGIAALEAQGGTNITQALVVASEHLLSAGRSDALPVIILLSDGRNGTASPPGPNARNIRNSGVQIYTIGLGAGIDEAVMREVAGSDDHYFYAPTPEELFPIYSEILRIVVSSLAGNLVIDDQMSDFVTYLGGSARPPALEGGERLRWGRSLLPATGVTLTYEILPISPGLIPTNRYASAEYTDGDGVRRSYAFPVPEILVITPTPTPTPEPRLAYLPTIYNKQCVPGRAHADVVLLIDTSSSMEGEKLAAAKRAALTLVEALDLAADQAAIVGFDSAPRVAASLTRDRQTLRAAVEGLYVSPGTRIDRALTAAEAELTLSAGRVPGNRGVVVLMSDGAHNGPAQEVEMAASSLRAHVTVLYVVGFGADVDAALLERLASPGDYFFAPGADELRAVYEEIAVRLPCR